MIPDLHIREDYKRRENRINLSLFGLFAVAPFRDWILSQLKLSRTAVVYPTTNVAVEGGSRRPDFVVRDSPTGAVVAWIEVECWRDEAQLDDYRSKFGERVISIWGRPERGIDLYLYEIAAFIDAFDMSSEHAQIRYNLGHLRKLIAEVLDGSAAHRNPLSRVDAAVLNTRLVRALLDILGDRLSLEIDGPMRPGEIRANSRGPRGFSLRVYSEEADDRTLSVFHRRDGGPTIMFPSKAKLNDYLAGREAAVEKLVELVKEMGGDMVRIKEKAYASVPIANVEKVVARLGAIVLSLAGHDEDVSE